MKLIVLHFSSKIDGKKSGLKYVIFWIKSECDDFQWNQQKNTKTSGGKFQKKPLSHSLSLSLICQIFYQTLNKVVNTIFITRSFQNSFIKSNGVKISLSIYLL